MRGGSSTCECHSVSSMTLLNAASTGFNKWPTFYDAIDEQGDSGTDQETGSPTGSIIRFLSDVPSSETCQTVAKVTVNPGRGCASSFNSLRFLPITIMASSSVIFFCALRQLVHCVRADKRSVVDFAHVDFGAWYSGGSLKLCEDFAEPNPIQHLE